MEFLSQCTHWFTTKQGTPVPCRVLWAAPEGQAQVRFWSAERQRPLAGLVREPSAGEGHTIIGLDTEEPEADADAEPGVATLQVRHEQSGQWVQFEGCASGATDTISCRAAGEVGCKDAREGDRLLVRVRSPDKVVQEQFTVFDVVEADNPCTAAVGQASHVGTSGAAQARGATAVQHEGRFSVAGAGQ